MMQMPYRVVGLQAAVTVLVAVVALGWGTDAMQGALVGGVAGFVPNWYFAWSAMRLGHSAPLSAGAGIFGRWATKMAMTVALVAIAMGVLKVGGLAFFIAFSVVLLVPVLAPLISGGATEPKGGGLHEGQHERLHEGQQEELKDESPGADSPGSKSRNDTTT